MLGALDMYLFVKTGLKTTNTIEKAIMSTEFSA
jgi:hypothetical protein